MNDRPKEKDDPRSLQIAARKKRMRELNPPLPRVRVNPKDDEMRRALAHPSGLKFPAESGSVEWPLDQFTRRRIKDGSVTREEGEHRDENRRQGSRRATAPPEPAA